MAPPMGVGQYKPFPPASGRHLLLPERGEIVDVIAEINDVPAVGI